MRLTPAAEAALRLYITRCDQLGMPALVPQLKNAVQYLLDLEEPTGYAPKVGQHFITRWLQRNPDCRRVKQKPREITRTAAAAEEAYKAHFDAVKEIKYRHGILPADTYNMDETGFRIGCVEFLYAIKGIRAATFKQRTILHAWEKAGIFPYNPEIVLKKLQLPRPSTPPPRSRHPVDLLNDDDALPPTPTSTRTFKRELQALQHDTINGVDVSQDRICWVLRGAAVIADDRALAERSLAEVTAVARARQERQNATRRQVQQGGVLTAAGARAAIDQRVKNEAAKVGKAAERKARQELIQRAAAAQRS
ncbi:hypothetical protein J3E72DRAFT_389724 [Bipolaris maydis]|nr:hypothetical protein J3E74DRAFT_422806 [Bipolaris maydis]KAJ6192178.1 hypothetical protein J3E72DRAFT_389724 [Bipolaris maydis]